MNMIYFNNSATSYPKPPCVLNAVNECIETVPFHSERSGFHFGSEDFISLAREAIADLLNIANPQHISFTSGSTESINLALRGLNLKDCHVVSTAIEHNSVIRPLERLKMENNIRVTYTPCDEYGMVMPEAIESAIENDTRLIVVNHCSNVTGAVLDLKSISEIARKNNILFMADISQSAGSVAVDVEGWGIDIAAFTGHKSLYGLSGTGGIYIREGLDIAPLKTGGTGILSSTLTQPKNRPQYYEAGTPNIPGLVSLYHGANWLRTVSIEFIHEHKRWLADQFYQYFHSHPDITIYGDYHHPQREGILSFNIHGMDPDDVGYILETSFNFVVRTGLHCSPLIHPYLGSQPNGCIRASFSIFNTGKQINLFIEAVEKICRAK